MPEPSYIVKVASATGSFGPKQFDNLENIGIADDIDPRMGVDSLKFSGRPDLLGLERGEVLQAFIRDENGLHNVFYGALITSQRGLLGAQAQPYQASARALLVGTGCRGERYKRVDTATIAYDLVSKHRHAALKVRAGDFPPSGTVLDEFDAVGSLADVLDELLELTENADYGAGVDPSGFVFFRPNTLKRSVEYEDTDYEDKELSSARISTATVWTLEEPPVITPHGGAYRPRPYTYVSVPDPPLHAAYGYETSRTLPLNALARVAGTNFTSSNFTNPGNAVDPAITTPAVRNAGTNGTFTITNDDPLVLGIRVVYLTSEDASAVRLRASCGVLYDVELPNTKGELQAIDIPLTPHDGTFNFWASFRLTAPTGGTVELHGFYPLRVDSAYLDSLTVVSVPEQRPGQIAESGIKPVPAVVELLNAPRGTYELPCAKVSLTWNPVEGAATITDLGVNPEEAEAAGLQRVAGYWRKPRG